MGVFVGVGSGVGVEVGGNGVGGSAVLEGRGAGGVAVGGTMVRVGRGVGGTGVGGAAVLEGASAVSAWEPQPANRQVNPTINKIRVQ